MTRTLVLALLLSGILNQSCDEVQVDCTEEFILVAIKVNGEELTDYFTVREATSDYRNSTGSGCHRGESSGDFDCRWSVARKATGGDGAGWSLSSWKTPRLVQGLVMRSALSTKGKPRLLSGDGFQLDRDLDT